MTSNQGGHRADVRFCFHTYLKNIFWKFQPSILPQSDLTKAFQNRDFRQKSIYRYLYDCRSRSQWPRTRAATGRTSGFVFIRILTIYSEEFSRLSCPDQISQQLFIREISVRNQFRGRSKRFFFLTTISDLGPGRPPGGRSVLVSYISQLYILKISAVYLAPFRFHNNFSKPILVRNRQWLLLTSFRDHSDLEPARPPGGRPVLFSYVS